MKPHARSDNSTRASRRKVSTIDRILTTAEILFGTYGIDAVSMREITIASGAANNSAIAYHFGDRESLVKAIMERRLPVLEKSRAVMLKKAIDTGQQHDPHVLVRILTLPAYELVDCDGWHRYAAFLRQALRCDLGMQSRRNTMILSPSSTTAYMLFRGLYPGIRTELFMWRSRAAISLFFDLVFDRDREIAAGNSVMPEKIFLNEALGLIVACCAGAPSS